MHKHTALVQLVFLFSASLHGSWVLFAAEQPDGKPDGKIFERVESTPDLPQFQEALPGRGNQYCAPVSASNGLAWLAKRGYPNLMPNNQVDLAKELGSPSFMNTSEIDGTGPKAIISGLMKYVKAQGYATASVKYQGWRSVNRQAARRIPGHSSPLRIGNGLRDKSIVLLNVGWYKKVGSEYQRLGGHWVTLVGTEKGDSPILIIHDPAGRSPEGIHERVTATRIRTGSLTGNKRELPTKAAGAWELGGELKFSTKKGADTAILDCAVLLRLK